MKKFQPNGSKRYIVTGPQRSGTTLSGKIIAHETNYRYIDEFDFAVADKAAFMAFAKLDNVVVHCPALMRWITDVADKDTCIVVIMRPIEEIINSQRRIRWGQEEDELAKYGLRSSGRNISEVKYEYWESVQKEMVPNYMEVDYHSWESHHMWVEDALREKFRPKQTRIGKIEVLKKKIKHL